MVASDRPTTPHRGCDCPQVTHYHGTTVTYKIHRCRCRDCLAARSRYAAGWYARRREPLGRILPRDEWLKVMRAGLVTAVSQSIEEHGRRFL